MPRSLRFWFSSKTLVRAFLFFFPTPFADGRADIERMYGQRKPIAQRIPLITPASTSGTSSPVTSFPTTTKPPDIRIQSAEIHDLSTPTVTEGETSDPDSEPETDDDDEEVEEVVPSGSVSPMPMPKRKSMMTLHDLMNLYFRKDVIVLRNVDLLRYALIFPSILISFLLTLLCCVK